MRILLTVIFLMSSTSGFAQLAETYTCVTVGDEPEDVLSGDIANTKLTFEKNIVVNTDDQLVGEIAAKEYAATDDSEVGSILLSVDVTNQMTKKPDGIGIVKAVMYTPELLHSEETTTGFLQLDLYPADGSPAYPYWSTVLSCTGH